MSFINRIGDRRTTPGPLEPSGQICLGDWILLPFRQAKGLTRCRM
ncbi:hypothetical protein RE6C_04373 [Rhodopirellula europaea 6C]|uniref:Uncharacterized protein n=1 Tax=Rhodopirellula europaea 6C TaxID=1263867 RepID=M2AD19_9BACT|nr:hypothetical protein RE6C_04373 [Rhodopirellula europaea 6C]